MTKQIEVPQPPITYNITYHGKYCGIVSKDKKYIETWCEQSKNDICNAFGKELNWVSINAFAINTRCKECLIATKKKKQ